MIILSDFVSLQAFNILSLSLSVMSKLSFFKIEITSYSKEGFSFSNIRLTADSQWRSILQERKSQRITGIGKAYVSYLIEKRTFFALMCSEWHGVPGEFRPNPSIAYGFNVLTNSIASWASVECPNKINIGDTATSLWSWGQKTRPR